MGQCFTIHVRCDYDVYLYNVTVMIDIKKVHWLQLQLTVVIWFTAYISVQVGMLQV